MAEPNSYEEQRRRQVEENMRKVNELGLHRLSAALREAAVKPMSTKEPKLRYNRPPPAPTRRSARVASLPKQPDYRHKKTPRRGLPPHRVYATDEAREYAFTKAKELNNQLSPDQPSFIRPVNHSCTTGTTFLYIPWKFETHLPSSGEMLVLVDEEDGKFPLRYLAERSAISAGWRLFVIDHKLTDGDCLVFQKVKRTEFKVYIVRARSYYEKDNC